ncbi:MAG: YggS family pyridoxal phosphate-dependent enzyme [Caldilineaceae bacterium]|nr:YggS family pyridoxal phosphate-dependent enzyme [Caldilineaceae bacterium]
MYLDQSNTAVQIAEYLADVRERMDRAARRAGREPREVTLVAVSKTHPIEAIQAAVAAGQFDFGENRLEELWPKVEQARALGLDQIRWHMIGTIQSRKTRDAVGPFVLIHSVDRMKVASRLSRDAQEAGRVLDVLCEVNVSAEASKHGFTPDELLAAAPALLELPGIRVHGLMTMAPLVEDPEATRPTFRSLRQLRERLAERFPQADWSQLSMGMTNDFEVAIEEGATIVRIGSAIFGARTE